jgi:hypothetical protein
VDVNKKISVYFLTLLFFNTMLIGDWYKIIAVNEPPVEHTFFVKKASRNIMAVLLHRILEDEDTSKDNQEDGEDSSETDEGPQEFFLQEFNALNFEAHSSALKHRLFVFPQSTRYSETLSPPPKA